MCGGVGRWRWRWRRSWRRTHVTRACGRHFGVPRRPDRSCGQQMRRKEVGRSRLRLAGGAARGIDHTEGSTTRSRSRRSPSGPTSGRCRRRARITSSARGSRPNGRNSATGFPDRVKMARADAKSGRRNGARCHDPADPGGDDPPSDHGGDQEPRGDQDEGPGGAVVPHPSTQEHPDEHGAEGKDDPGSPLHGIDPAA